MKKLGRNKDDQKCSNRGLILQLIATKQCSSRIDLSKTIGLTKTAISQITAEMIDSGLIEEAEREIRTETGRNPVKLVISPKAPKFIGVLIGRTTCAAVLCDLNLQVLKKDQIYREWTNEQELIEYVCMMIDRMLAENMQVMSMGVAAIGPVNITEGTIVNPFYFQGISNVQIRNILEEKYSLPVYFDHDNQSAALAEFLYGSGRGYQDILLISIGRGVGCGIMVQGHRMHSTYGYAPEIGHISIDHQGAECVCGNRGCLEMYINSDAMMKKFREITGKDLTYEQYMELTDEPAMDEAMQICVRQLSAALVSTLNLLNSQLILLGMDCCYWPERYIRMLEAEVNRVKFGNRNVTIPVKKAGLRMDAQLMGAACNAMSRVFNGDIFESEER